jgi:hypothetical protein
MWLTRDVFFTCRPSQKARRTNPFRALGASAVEKTSGIVRQSGMNHRHAFTMRNIHGFLTQGKENRRKSQ